jgi:hypothetical protein
MAALVDWISWLWACFVANRENLLSAATILAGAIGIPLLFIRTRAADRSARAALEQARVAAEQAKTAADRHNAQTDADRERRITESFAKAVEQLGSDKLETRLGGIYTLERLAQESEREYWPIMETLTAYVREHAPWPPRQAAFHPFVQLLDAGTIESAEESPSSDERGDQGKEPEPRSERIRPATDVQAILTVLGRRKRCEKEMRDREGENRRLDLSETDLRGALLSGAHLEDAVLTRAHLEGAFLFNAHLKDAILLDAHLEGAHLFSAHLKDAVLKDAYLEGAILINAYLEGAILINAHLEGAVLAHARNLTQEQINSALGNKNTKLPKGLERPAHWTKR